MCSDYRMSAAGMEFGFHENIVPIISRAFGGDWEAMNEVVAEVQQSFVNSTFLARLIRERLADELRPRAHGDRAPRPCWTPRTCTTWASRTAAPSAT
jgi:hypothetical protein